MVKYSVGHCADFFRGIKKLVDLFSEQELPLFKIYIERAEQLLKRNTACKNFFIKTR
jgi:hypothetical protein